MSRSQPREAERGAMPPQVRDVVMIREAAPFGVSARSRGMEGLDVPQHRAKAKLRKATDAWVTAPPSATPDIQSWHQGIGDGCGGKLYVLTQGDLHWSGCSGKRGEGNDDPPMPMEKSDHLVVTLKPGNAGGVKEVTG